ncbi:hypothetical protein D6745_03485 [Candidatus Woesearchaeota archaeon]|nr:MAG: hypothetical protein D6745_03485 [Candidatus Woesearchaeota archaeon]
MIIIIVSILIFVIFPDYFYKFITESDYSLALTMAYYLPGFFILMGLIEVWLPESFIIHHLGKHSGAKGSLYSFLLGAVIPGPLYIAFPIAGILLKRGISKFNAVVFLSTWACFKINDEVFELQFLGLKFFLLRILITLPIIFVMAFLISKIHFYAARERN